MTCPDDDVLIALDDGELAESQARSVRAHVETCTRCRATRAEIAELGADLRAPVPGALGAPTAEAFADGILAAIDRPRATRRERTRPLARWAALLAAAALLPLATVEVVRRARAPEPQPEWTARGTDVRAMDAPRPFVRFGVVAGSAFEPIVDGATVAEDALLAAESSGEGDAPRYLLAFLIDATGERHWIYPVYEPGAAPPASVALPVTQGSRVLGSMTRLDHPAHGPAELVAVVLPRSETVDYVERAAREQLSRERLAARYEGSVVLVTRVEIRP